MNRCRFLGAYVDVEGIVEGYAASQRALGRTESERDDLKKQLKAAVTELARLREAADAPPGIESALNLLAQGDAAKAEAIFQTIATKREKDIKEAAAAYRHLGALAYLTDTQKALDAYRRATELDPNNPDGWNGLGHLLYRTGKIDEAFTAYHRVEAIGKLKGDNALLAVAYGNLSGLYLTRGDLDQAEAMYKMSLAINEALGSKEGMAKKRVFDLVMRNRTSLSTLSTTATWATSTTYGATSIRPRRCTKRAW